MPGRGYWSLAAESVASQQDRLADEDPDAAEVAACAAEGQRRRRPAARPASLATGVLLAVAALVGVASKAPNNPMAVGADRNAMTAVEMVAFSTTAKDNAAATAARDTNEAVLAAAMVGDPPVAATAEVAGSMGTTLVPGAMSPPPSLSPNPSLSRESTFSEAPTQAVTEVASKSVTGTDVVPGAAVAPEGAATQVTPGVAVPVQASDGDPPAEAAETMTAAVSAGMTLAPVATSPPSSLSPSPSSSPSPSPSPDSSAAEVATAAGSAGTTFAPVARSPLSSLSPSPSSSPSPSPSQDFSFEVAPAQTATKVAPQAVTEVVPQNVTDMAPGVEVVPAQAPAGDLLAEAGEAAAVAVTVPTSLAPVAMSPPSSLSPSPSSSPPLNPSPDSDRFVVAPAHTATEVVPQAVSEVAPGVAAAPAQVAMEAATGVVVTAEAAVAAEDLADRLGETIEPTKAANASFGNDSAKLTEAANATHVKHDGIPECPHNLLACPQEWRTGNSGGYYCEGACQEWKSGPFDNKNCSDQCSIGATPSTITSITSTTPSIEEGEEYGSPSMICFSVARSGTELDQISFQHDHSAGIFACDETMVFVDEEGVELNGGFKTTLLSDPIGGGVSKDGTAANTEVFLQTWEMLRQDGRYLEVDWSVKVDPDAILLPDRLRNNLRDATGKTIFVKNCDKYQGDNWPQMFGAVETISTQAVSVYFDGEDKCRNELDWEKWGEDLFMSECLSHLGVEFMFDGNQVGDDRCNGVWCGAGEKAAFHPFKSVGSWEDCWREATGQVQEGG